MDTLGRWRDQDTHKVDVEHGVAEVLGREVLASRRARDLRTQHAPLPSDATLWSVASRCLQR